MNAIDLSIAMFQTADGVVVRVYVQTKARCEQLIGMYADRLKVAVTEPPERGRANAAVLRLLAESTGKPVSSVELLRGVASRKKDILLRGQLVEDVANRLLHAVAGQ